MIINTNELEQLLAIKNLTSYQITKNTGIASNVIDRHRKKLEQGEELTLTLPTAKKLQQYINKLKNSNEWTSLKDASEPTERK